MDERWYVQCVEDYVNQVHIFQASSRFFQTFHLKIEVKIRFIRFSLASTS